MSVPSQDAACVESRSETDEQEGEREGVEETRPGRRTSITQTLTQFSSLWCLSEILWVFLKIVALNQFKLGFLLELPSNESPTGLKMIPSIVFFLNFCLNLKHISIWTISKWWWQFTLVPREQRLGCKSVDNPCLPQHFSFFLVI